MTESAKDRRARLTIEQLSRQLAEQRERADALAALAAERAQFILNAVDLGYCQLPDSDTPDSAHDTYERCKLADSAATTSRDSRVKAEVLWDMANRLRRDAEQINDGCKASAVIEMAWRKLDNESARLYRQAEEASE